MNYAACVLLLAGIAWGQELFPVREVHITPSATEWNFVVIHGNNPICFQFDDGAVQCSELPVTTRHLPVLPLQEPSTLGTVTDIGPHENYQISEGTYEGLIVPYPKVTEPSYYWDDDKPDDAPFTCRPHETQPNSFVCKIARHAEPSDVPAIQVCKTKVKPWEICPGDPNVSDEEFRTHGPGGYRWTCKEKSRILLTAEDGSRYCVKF